VERGSYGAWSDFADRPDRGRSFCGGRTGPNDYLGQVTGKKLSELGNNGVGSGFGNRVNVDIYADFSGHSTANGLASAFDIVRTPLCFFAWKEGFSRYCLCNFCE